MTTAKGLQAITLAVLLAACGTAGAPAPQLSLLPATIPTDINQDASNTFEFVLRNDSTRAAELCVLRQLSGKITTIDGKSSWIPLIPYHGSISHGCAETVKLEPSGSHSIKLELRTMPKISAGPVTITFGMAVGGSARGPWVELETVVVGNVLPSTSGAT